MEDSYIPIDIHTIGYDDTQTFDVYFNSRNEKKILYCANKGVVNKDVRENIIKHNINILYISDKDKVNYNLYLEKNLGKILDNTEISTPIKSRTSFDLVMNVAKSLFESPRAEIIKRYKSVIYDTMECILKDDEFFIQLLKHLTFDFTVYNHSINVGIISMGLTKELMRGKKYNNLREIAAGFFLHDIGKCKIPKEILNKKTQLSHDEWNLIKRHPQKGIQILSNAGALSKEARFIVLQHHERENGNGYPEGLRGSEIHIAAKICSLADVFDGLTSKRPFREEYSTFKALTIMKKEMFSHFAPEFFEKFLKLFCIK